MRRRSYLRLVSAGTVVAIAGCSSSTDTGDGDEDGDRNDGGNSNESRSDNDTTNGNGDQNTTSNESDVDENSKDPIPVIYNARRYDRLATPDSEGVFYESDSEQHYVGVQLRIDNTRVETISLTPWDLMLSVDGTIDDVSIHTQSKAGVLEEIPAGETIETWLFYTVPPEGELGLVQTENETTDYEFEITHDPDLEIALREYKDD